MARARISASLTSGPARSSNAFHRGHHKLNSLSGISLRTLLTSSLYRWYSSLMKTRTFRNAVYTVTSSRRGWKNDRTIYALTGPKGGLYTLVEFDSGNTVLTDLANGRSRREYPSVPPAPSKRAEIEDERYGWNATLANLDRHVAELAQAIETFQSRDRETTSASGLAGKIRVAAWAIAADTSHLSHLEAIGAE